MEYTLLGKSGIEVSRICMGCMGFGDTGLGMHKWTLDLEESRKIIAHGFENGINFFDTALSYQGGSSEQYVGRILRDMAPRDQYVVATKFLPITKAELDEGVSGREHI